MNDSFENEEEIEMRNAINRDFQRLAASFHFENRRRKLENGFENADLMPKLRFRTPKWELILI